MTISARYVSFMTTKDGDYVQALNQYLRADVRPAVIAVQHVEFLYVDREAVMEGRPTGAKYLVTFGG